MIRKPNNWDSVQAFSDRPKLPLGAYVCKVKQVRVQDTNYGPQLCLLFDITEGEHAGFFQKDFNANVNADKKWRGAGLRKAVEQPEEGREEGREEAGSAGSETLCQPRRVYQDCRRR